MAKPRKHLMAKSVAFFKGYFVKIGLFIRTVPGWLKSRPAAFRRWRQEDKKKKKYRTLKLQKKIKPEPRDIPPAVTLFRQTLQFIWRYKKIYLAIVLIYSVVYFILIRSPIPTDMESIQDVVELAFGANSGQSLEGSLATLSMVLGSSSNLQNAGTASLGVLILSMVTVWATRQIHNKQEFKARDAYYQGLTGLFPVLIVLIVLSLQMVPFAIASFIYTTARRAQLFISGVEDMAFFLVALLIGLLSLYWITSTIIALYIASLPGVYPMQALRSAKKLVQFQRFMVFRRLITLPVILGLSYALILLIFIRFFPSRAFLAAEILQIVMIPLANVYLYKLYRALI